MATKMDIVKQAVRASLRIPTAQDQEAWDRLAGAVLASAWQRDESTIIQLFRQTRMDMGASIINLDVTEPPVRFYGRDRTKVDEDGGFVKYEGIPDCDADMPQEHSRSGIIPAQERHSKTFVVMSPYDDTLFGEFNTAEEAKSHASFISRSCYVACYDKSYGLEWEDWTTAPDYGVDKLQGWYKDRAHTRALGAAAKPRSKPKNAMDETYQPGGADLDQLNTLIQETANRLEYLQAKKDRLLASQKR
jgi:hypothetical protein